MTDALFDVPGAPEPTEPVVLPTPAALPPVTEAQVLAVLRARYSMRYGNGYRYAYAEHVRSGPGFADGKRVADAIAMDLWESKGLELHGHEVKVSRSDWLTELRDPSKAEAFRPYMHRWWLVVPDVDIVRDDLPDGWGLMFARPGKPARAVRRAPRLNPAPVPHAMLGTLMRAAATTAERGVQRHTDHGDELLRSVASELTAHVYSGVPAPPLDDVLRRVNDARGSLLAHGNRRLDP